RPPLGRRAQFFLRTAHIDTPGALWFDRLAMAFKSATARRAELADGQLLSLSTVSDRLAALDAALTHLKRLSDDERADSVEQLMTSLRPNLERPKRLMLSWDEVDALRGLGFSIGAHTITHPILSRLTADRAWGEIHGSKAAIEKAVGGSAG